MADFNQQIIQEFRDNAGKVGGMFEGTGLVLLTTVGARSGKRRTSPVGYARDGDRILVFASNAGQPKHPDWYHNLLANPQVTVETGTKTFAAIAVPLHGEERDRLYAEQGKRVPDYANYQVQTDRVIPVVALYRSDAAHDREGSSAERAEGTARARALGDELVRIHQGLRRELAAVRAGVRAGGADLRIHCLAFCGALHAHHTNEDGAFPRIEQQVPELGPVLARLRQEHATLALWIRQLQDLLDADADADVRQDLDRLAGELEVHFAYEEEHLVPALNKLTGR
jgi:deazaflavin-dependent oxidoreductase (nitroreductase family)